MSNLLNRYDELVFLQVSDAERIEKIVAQQSQVILAIDGMQPNVGHEVLWVIREVLSGEILLAKTLLSSTSEDLAPLLMQVKQALNLPIIAVVSDGQSSIRNAIAKALSEAAHGLCHFHYLRQAARPIDEADRHAKKELKKRVRGVRKIERTLSQESNAINEVVEGYCQAVRAALTDDGQPPLDASGLTLRQRLSAIDASLERIDQKGNFQSH
ncbi:transposase [Phormidium tenue FACHB-886]|nr:transposase [Phormidium tenue FACHB-886]